MNQVLFIFITPSIHWSFAFCCFSWIFWLLFLFLSHNFHNSNKIHSRKRKKIWEIYTGKLNRFFTLRIEFSHFYFPFITDDSRAPHFPALAGSGSLWSPPLFLFCVMSDNNFTFSFFLSRLWELNYVLFSSTSAQNGKDEMETESRMR